MAILMTPARTTTNIISNCVEVSKRIEKVLRSAAETPSIRASEHE